MHYLHRILVYIPDIDDDWENKEELKELIRSKAEYETENYSDQTFDWRETESAGRWRKEYPEQVYIAADNLEWFINELESVLASQKHEIDNCFKNIAERGGTNLNDIVNELWNLTDTSDNMRTGCNEFTAYYLSKLGKLLYGEYTSDSMFFNASVYTARLYQSDIEQIKAAPQDWALVMFDYHN